MRLCLSWMMSIALALPAHAAEDKSPLMLSYVETADARLVYFDWLSHLAPLALRSYTNSHAWQRQMFGWVPSQPTTLFMKDFSDYGNGSAWAAPRNTVFFEVSPPSLAFETNSPAERIYSLMNHELVHVAASDVAAAQDRAWRRLFRGKVTPNAQNPESLLYAYLTVPRFNVPRWHLEGSAVFFETWMAGGLGRAQGGYDEMVFRAMVRDDQKFFDPLGLVSLGVRSDFQVGANAYLYGARFFTWLAYAHTPQKVVAWMRRDEGSKRHYADQFAHVFGLPLEQAWQDWVAFEKEFQRANLRKVRAHPITPQRNLRGAALGSVSRTFYDESSGTLYGGLRMPGVVEHIGALNTRDGSLRRLGDVKRGMLYRVTSLAFDPASGTAFFTNDNLAQRDLMALDVKTGEQRMLLEDARIGDIVFNPVDRSLMGVRHEHGLATLVRIAAPYAAWEPVHKFDYGVVPFDLDISADGRRLSASIGEVNGDHFVRVWDLQGVLGGDIRHLSEFRFGQSVPESFVFSRDGRYLYGSSYYTGVSNIFRYEVTTGAVEAVSNAETGYFRPLELANGQMIVLSYTGEGFVPAVIDPKPVKHVGAITFLGAELAKRQPIVTRWQVPPPSAVDEEKLITRRGPYVPLREVTLQNVYPVLQGYKSAAGAGLQFNFEDPLRFAALSVTAAWTPGTADLPGDQRFHLDIHGRYLGWRAALAWNRSDFYDLFGPTKRSRKGYAVRLGHDHALIYDNPRKLELSVDLAHRGKIDTLPNAQTIGTPFTRLTTGEVKLSYSDLRRSLGAVDDEKGIAWTTALTVNRAGDRASALVLAGFDAGMALPIEHSSIWSRTVAGAARGRAGDPVASFYFGGFGNNRVDNGNVKRYREAGAMPGFDLDAVAARRFVKQTVEWSLPPWGFESVGSPGFHLTWARPAVFASALRADAGHAGGRRTVANLGGQVDFRLSTLHWYEMMVSFGVARGFERSRPTGTEWMVSLKVL